MEPVPADFRKHFRKHNREVLAVTLFSTVMAVVVWSGVYGVVYVGTLVLCTIGGGVDAAAPPHFPLYFGVGAAGLCLFRMAVREIIVPEKLRASGWYFLWIVTDLLFFPPNLLLAIPGNLAAMVWLRKPELQAAWDILRILDRGKRVSLSKIPYVVADDGLRERAMMALQLSGLIRVDPMEHDWRISLKTEDAASLASGRVRFSTYRRRKA